MFKEFLKELGANLFGSRTYVGEPNKPAKEFIEVNGQRKPTYKQKIKDRFTLSVDGTGDAFNAPPLDLENDTLEKSPSLGIGDTKPFVDMLKNAWSNVGRPASNPYQNEFSEVFGVDAPRYEKIARWGEPKPGDKYGSTFGGENLSFDGTAQNTNKNGTIDYGLIQANDETFYDMKRIYPDYMMKAGINEPKDLLNVRKNLLFTKLVDYTYGNRWFGASKNAPNTDREYWPNAPYEWGQRIGTQDFDFNQY